jgi:hypothetical protein
MEKPEALTIAGQIVLTTKNRDYKLVIYLFMLNVIQPAKCDQYVRLLQLRTTE